jgi:predicted nucleic acid-binding protein
VPERPAINASPLIFLARGGLLDLLRLAGEEIVVPAAVAGEIQRRGPTDLTVQAIERTAWLVVVATLPIPSLIQSWGLGEGESSVLAWAYANPGTEAIIDDLAGRRCAAALGIPVRGTLGLILTARQQGRIPAARPVLEHLRALGMHLSDHVLNEALALVGE